MSPLSSRVRGARLEDIAETWLAERGLVREARNYSCRGGEIDLVMRHGEITVFVEVRYRRNSTFGTAEESVDFRKQARLIKAARHYLSFEKRNADTACRFDLMALSGDEHRPSVNWIENAFSA